MLPSRRRAVIHGAEGAIGGAVARLSRATPLGRLPRVAEVASVATVMASDGASAMTGTFVHVTCGSRE